MAPYRHAGGMFDRGTTWVKHGTRWNDTTTGAWTTTDPITHLNDPTNANPYQYAGGNPCNHVDPTGESTASVFCGLAGVIAGSFGAFVTPFLTESAASMIGVTVGMLGGALIGAGASFAIGIGMWAICNLLVD